MKIKALLDKVRTVKTSDTITDNTMKNAELNAQLEIAYSFESNENLELIAIGGMTSASRMAALALSLSNSHSNTKGNGNNNNKPFTGIYNADDLYKSVVGINNNDNNNNSFNLLQKTDKQFSDLGFNQTQMLMPKLALVTALLKVFKVKKCRYCYTNGSTEGILVDTDLQQ